MQHNTCKLGRQRMQRSGQKKSPTNAAAKQHLQPTIWMRSFRGKKVQVRAATASTAASGINNRCTLIASRTEPARPVPHCCLQHDWWRQQRQPMQHLHVL